MHSVCVGFMLPERIHVAAAVRLRIVALVCAVGAYLLFHRRARFGRRDIAGDTHSACHADAMRCRVQSLMDIFVIGIPLLGKGVWTPWARRWARQARCPSPDF